MGESLRGVRLVSSEGIYYLKPESVLVSANVSMVSSEGDVFVVNKLILASFSHFLHDLLLDSNQEDEDNKIVLVTQISKLNLEVFCQFLTRGTLPQKPWHPDLISSFQNLGVDLSDKSFHPLVDCEIKKEEAEDSPEVGSSRKRRHAKEVLTYNEDIFDDIDEGFDCQDAKCDEEGSDMENKPLTRKKRKYESRVRNLGALKKRPCRAPDSDTVWACEWCEDKFSNKRILACHKMLFHSDRAEQCDRCFGLVLVQKPASVKTHQTCKIQHQCLCCGVKERQVSALEEHWKQNGPVHSKSPYQCPLCPPGTEFTTFLDHYSHCRDVHEGVVVLPCPQCDEVFGTRPLLSDHIAVDHSSGDERVTLRDFLQRDLFKLYQCDKCCLGYMTQEGLEAHEARHKSGKVANEWDPTPFACTVCQRQFSSSRELRGHHVEEHGDAPVQCNLCEKSFMSSANHSAHGKLRHHMKKVHRGPPKGQDVCVCCGEIFELRSKYMSHLRQFGPYHNNRCAYKECSDVTFESWPQHEEHVKQNHDGIFVHRCRHCPEYFRSEYLASAHMKSVHLPAKQANQPKEMCVHCGKLMLKNAMRVHLMTEHNNTEFPCDECPKVFPNKYRLQTHKKTHDKCNPCPHCGKNDFSKSMLKRHIVIHHTPDHLKPVQCSQCHKGFDSQRILDWHMNVHTGAKPFKCHICNAAFAHPSNQRAHIKGHHEGIKRAKK